MPRPRKSQIAVEATPYYHCVSRCVRRAFLCGADRFTGKSYDHRRAFIEEELLRLGQVFYLDVVAYAVMSNHYHVVLYIDQDTQKAAGTKDIVTRWHQLHKGNSVSVKYLEGEALEPHEVEQLNVLVDKWREQLASISWYMRVLNEKVARMANREDDVTGRFWEGRFKCQALLDEQALLSCMAYVDLNLVRAAMAKTPEESDYTSLKRRVNYWKNASERSDCGEGKDRAFQPDNLHPFAGNLREPMAKGIIFNLVDYLQLVDWTGRCIRGDKIGAIEGTAEPILKRLSITPEHWIYLCTNFESRFKGLVGSAHSLKQACDHFGRQRIPNLSISTTLFS